MAGKNVQRPAQAGLLEAPAFGKRVGKLIIELPVQGKQALHGLSVHGHICLEARVIY